MRATSSRLVVDGVGLRAWWRRLHGAAMLLAGLAVGLLSSLQTGSATAAATDSGTRVALVIGNAAYRTARLANPVNDARAVGRTLRELGFKVISLENASQQQMHEAVRQFGDALQGGVGLFYFAGHGVQVKGRNYLVPVDAEIEREDEVPYKAFDAGQVLAKMESAKNPLNIVILDACRNNPFARASRSGAAGLAQMDAPAGSIVAFATAPGAEAADGSTGNGLYTGQLLRFMTTPGLKVEEVFKRTRVAVKQASGGRQIPWESTSLEGDFYFARGAGTAPAAQASNLDDELWQLVVDAGHPSAYRAYLEKYPSGRHAEQARSMAARSAPAAAPDTAPPPSRTGATTGGFSFSAEEQKMDRAMPQGRERTFEQAMAALACPAERRRARVRVALDGPQGGAFAAVLSQRLQQAGLQVSPTGDVIVAGTVSAQASLHRTLRVSEVAVNAAVTMSSAGRQLASSIVREESYAGADAGPVVGELLRSQATEVATQLLTQWCRR